MSCPRRRWLILLATVLLVGGWLGIQAWMRALTADGWEIRWGLGVKRTGVSLASFHPKQIIVHDDLVEDGIFIQDEGRISDGNQTFFMVREFLGRRLLVRAGRTPIVPNQLTYVLRDDVRGTIVGKGRIQDADVIQPGEQAMLQMADINLRSAYCIEIRQAPLESPSSNCRSPSTPGRRSRESFHKACDRAP